LPLELPKPVLDNLLSKTGFVNQKIGKVKKDVERIRTEEWPATEIRDYTKQYESY